jgi:hypothetical protein
VATRPKLLLHQSNELEACAQPLSGLQAACSLKREFLIMQTPIWQQAGGIYFRLVPGARRCHPRDSVIAKGAATLNGARYGDGAGRQ